MEVDLVAVEVEELGVDDRRAGLARRLDDEPRDGLALVDDDRLVARDEVGRLEVRGVLDLRDDVVELLAPAGAALGRARRARPTRRERSSGRRTAVPAGTALRDLRIDGRVVTVDLAARFAAGRDDASLDARVGQLVRTLRAVPGVVGVLRDASGSYALPFYGCIGLELTAAVLIMIRGRSASLRA